MVERDLAKVNVVSSSLIIRSNRRNSMKMYILIREDVDLGHAFLAAAHGTLQCYLKFKDRPIMAQYIDPSLPNFRKCVCKVSLAEFNKAKTYEDYVIVTESGLGGMETALVFCPREEWPKFFSFVKLYR